MQGVMNAFAQTSARALSGSKLDNRRVLAALIDLAIVGVGGAAVLVLGGGDASLGAPLAAVVVGWALYYFFACESGGGQTVGKKVTRLRVVRGDGAPAGMREIAIRTVLRLVDILLVGLIAIMATGERRARLGDLAAGTMVVSTDGAPSAPAAEVAAAAIEVAAVAEDGDTPLADDGVTPLAEDGVTPLAEDELDAAGEALAELEYHEPARAYEPITGVAAEDAEPEPVAEEAELIVEAWPPADNPPPANHTLDVETPALKELAQDVAAAAGSDQESEAEPETVVEVVPVPQPRPLAEVEIGGPEIDVDEPQVTVRSVDTVSAIDLIMGADDPSEDRPAADEPPAGA
jgi:uncharacterized RDD family membrane protein YckC